MDHSEKPQSRSLKIFPEIFSDLGDLIPEHSLAFVERIRPSLNGRIIKLVAERGTPHTIYNTRLYTDQNEEIHLSGFTCGKVHAGALALCELIVILGMEKAIPRQEIVRIVLENDKFSMEWHDDGTEKKLQVH